jgi:glyoxylase-like metal-dependent hydrolase (beta-lactamase superfamily II)
VSDARTYLERFARTLPSAASGLLRPRRPTGAELADVGFAEPPSASAGVRVHALLQNEWDAPTAAVVEGQLTPPTTRMAIGAFLVEHPSGTFLADAGICADAHTRHLADMPALVRNLTAGPPPRLGIAASIEAAGFAVAQLQFALLTHVHWDHVSGLAELPGLPARVDARDLPLVAAGAPFQPGVAPAAVQGVAFDGLHLDGPPVLTFPASHDVFGDGSVVLCDLSGHTPGHAGILLALRSGSRVLLAGDAIWNLAQQRLVRQRSALARLADADPDAAYRTIVRLSRLPAEITVLPAHDHAAITSAFAGGPLE